MRWRGGVIIYMRWLPGRGGVIIYMRWLPGPVAAVGDEGDDQVGVELEGPFGVDDNDFPLLTMGLAMCNDLDAMVRTVSRTRMEARLTSFASTESHQIQGAAALALGWAEAAESS